MAGNPQRRTAVVTGARSGLGAAIATALVADGWTVWGTARDPSKLTAQGVRPLALDLCDAGALDRFVAVDLPAIGDVDLLVNNAGAGLFGDFWGFDDKQVEEQMALMLTAPMVLTRAVLPGMLRRAGGGIVNVSSLAARFPLPCMTPYNSAKAGLSGFSRSLAAELSGTPLRVIDFQPGDICTPFNANMQRSGGRPGAWAALERNIARAPAPDAIARKLLRAVHSGRRGTVTAGSFFQAVLAPLGQRLLPGSVFRALERAYFRG